MAAHSKVRRYDRGITATIDGDANRATVDLGVEGL